MIGCKNKIDTNDANHNANVANYANSHWYVIKYLHNLQHSGKYSRHSYLKRL